MEVSQYGVNLKRLTLDKIEMVRQWRNNPEISKYMEYREIITPEMQLIWFHKINNENNYYFVIEVGEKEIGLINVRDIDLDNKIGEGGIFINKSDELEPTVAIRAILCLYNFCFEKIKLEKVRAHILRDNKRAIRFNRALGFQLGVGQENEYNQEYIVDKDTYYKCREKLLLLIKRQ